MSADGDSTPADSGAIDLAEMHAMVDSIGMLTKGSANRVLAEVEALRERVAKLDEPVGEFLTNAIMAALATTPAEALERARAVEGVINVCRKFKQQVEAGGILTAVTHCQEALAKLNALGKKKD